MRRSSEPAAFGRLRWAGGGLVAAIALLVSTWVLSTVVQSPQDALARAAAPPPSRITFPVEQQVLSTPGRPKSTNDAQVLVVPVSALFTSPTDDVYVVVAARDEHLMRVEVVQGRRVGGFVHVQARDPATLRPGDEVLVSELP